MAFVNFVENEHLSKAAGSLNDTKSLPSEQKATITTNHLPAQSNLHPQTSSFYDSF